MIQSVLAEAGLRLSDCDAIAFGSGPGSFTGVRTACGLVQGLAFGSNLPVIPIVTLHAMAYACREVSGASDILAVLDARMGEVYSAQYRYEQGWQVVIPPALSLPSALAAEGNFTACGNALNAYRDEFRFEAKALVDAYPNLMPHAAQIVRLGELEWLQGRFVSAHEAQPVYLRNKIAFTTAERAAKVAA